MKYIAGFLFGAWIAQSFIVNPDHHNRIRALEAQVSQCQK